MSSDKTANSTKSDSNEQQATESIGDVIGLVDSTESRGDDLEVMLDLYVYAPLRIALTDWRTFCGGLILVLFILLGTLGVMIVPEPKINSAEPYLSPFVNWQFPLGTDQMGAPIGYQIVHATPAMLKMAFAGGLAATSAAIVIGVTAGYKGGLIDRSLMQLTDVALTVPGLPLVILLAAVYEPKDPFVVGLILAIDNWPGLARALRAQVLTLREASYVEASRVMGISSKKILVSDIVPQLMPYILINGASAARRVIFESVALYFLGLLAYSQINWGVMMEEAYSSGALSNLGRGGHWLFFPMLTLIGLSVGLILLSQGLDRVFNPRLRARHAKTVTEENTVSTE